MEDDGEEEKHCPEAAAAAEAEGKHDMVDSDSSDRTEVGEPIARKPSRDLEAQ